jgi:hypothetical protein
MDTFGIVLISIVSVLLVMVIASFVVLGIAMSAYYQTSEGRASLKRKR